MYKTAVFLLLVQGLIWVSAQSPSTCALDSNGRVPQRQLSSCVAAIKQAAEDSQAFWYGRDYSTNCPDPDNDVNCRPGSRLSTGTGLIRRVIFSYLDDLDRFLYVSYSSPPGSYENQCGTKAAFSSSTQFSLNPLNETGIPAWYTRQQPAVQWDTWQSQFFTLLMVDTGSGTVNWAAVNIRGNDLGTGEVIQQYRSPLNYRKWVTPFVFMLFTQNRRISVDDNWRRQLTQDSQPVDLFNFQRTTRIIGPVAVNWMRSEADAYSVGTWASTRNLQNCGALVLNIVEERQIPFFANVPRSQQSTYFTVEYTADDFSAEFCCRQISYRGGTFVLDPIGNASIVPAWTRTDSRRRYLATYDTDGPSEDDFRGKLYTFMMLDPSPPPPYTVFGNWDRPMLHGMDVNMVRQADGSFLGETPYPYFPPGPPSPFRHGNYFFLMFEQQRHLSGLDTTRYALRDCQLETDRCNFDLRSFAADSGLSLLGATWMVVLNDDYVNATAIARGRDRGEMCNYIPGYDSCIGPGGQTIMPILTDSPTMPPGDDDEDSGDGMEVTYIALMVVLPPTFIAAMAWAAYYMYYYYYG